MRSHGIPFLNFFTTLLSFHKCYFCTWEVRCGRRGFLGWFAFWWQGNCFQKLKRIYLVWSINISFRNLGYRSELNRKKIYWVNWLKTGQTKSEDFSEKKELLCKKLHISEYMEGKAVRFLFINTDFCPVQPCQVGRKKAGRWGAEQSEELSLWIALIWKETVNQRPSFSSVDFNIKLPVPFLDLLRCFYADLIKMTFEIHNCSTQGNFLLMFCKALKIMSNSNRKCSETYLKRYKFGGQKCRARTLYKIL